MSFIYVPRSGLSSGVLMIVGDNGGIASADTVTLTGDANGPFFTGAASTMTESFNYVSLPTTTSTVGQVTLNGNRFLHGYGTNNVYLGTNAGNFSNTTISSSAIGYQAMQNITANINSSIGIGVSALQSVGGINNVAIGYQAGYQLTTSCQNNVIIGTNASNDAGTTVQNSTVIGLNAMSGSAKTGTTNCVVVGANAGIGITTGDFNVLFGDSAGQDLTTASSSIRINNVTKANTGNQLVIGAGTGTGTQQLNEAFIHGIRGITTVNNNAIAVLIDSAGQLGTVSSSARFKENIEDMNEISSPVLNLRPVTFDFIGKPSHKKQVGLIAEEVKPIIPDLVVHDKDGQIESVKYHEISIYLLNEIKKALKRVEYLESKLAL